MPLDGHLADLLKIDGHSFEFDDRARLPESTVANMLSRFGQFGITRLARVTGLDCIGIPVWTAIRPNSRTLAVSQGKGIDDPSAQASAIMEAVEVATAERCDFPHISNSAHAFFLASINFDALPSLIRKGEHLVGENDELKWIEGYDLIQERSVLVPLEAVVLSDQKCPTRYWQSTDGLASGNILWEAVMHGLCERIERDALALWSLRNDVFIESQCVETGGIVDPTLVELIRRIDQSGLQLRLFDITSDVAVPVFQATISQKPDTRLDKWKYFDLASGSGCHPDPRRAMYRAITEAAQTRLTTISGARDDFDPNTFRTDLDKSLSVFVRATPRLRFNQLEIAKISRSEYLPMIINRLKAVGSKSLIVVPLENGTSGFAVAKVFIPDLESPPGNRRFLHGKRALKLMLSQ